MWKIFRLLFFYIFTVAVSCNLSYGQITLTSVQSGDWDDQATWGNTGPPTDTDNVIIVTGHTVMLAGKTTINNLTINGGGVLNDNNKDLTINGNFILNGTKTGKKGTIFNGGAGTFIGGTGVHSSTNSLTINQSTSIQTGAVLTFTEDIELEANVIVTNNGSVSVTNDLKGANNTSSWINSTSSTLTVGGKLLNKGTLDASAQGNTVIYNRDNDQDIKLPTGSPPTYFNLVVEGIGDKTLTGDITIDGSLTINSSTLDTSQGDNFAINIKGDFTNFGVFNENLSTITFEGPNPQIITNSAGETFYNVIVNKPSGSIVLEDDVTISNTLDLLSGIIKADPGSLILGTGPANPGTLNITSGQIIGPFERWISNALTGVDIEFPVGSQIANRSAIVNFTGINIGGVIVFEFIATNPGNNGLTLVDGTETIYNTFVDGYWDMQVSDGFDLGANTFSLSLDGTGLLGFPVDIDTRLLTRASQSSDWIAEGTHVNAINPIVNRTGLSTIGAQYTFGDNTNCSGPITTSITGSTNVCTNDFNEQYSVTDNGNIYIWTIIGGIQTSGGNSASITVDWGSSGQIGNVSVIEFNGCTYGEAVNLQVEINSIPPGLITGKTAVAESSQNEPYSVLSQSGYSYTWSISGGNLDTGQGSNSVTVDWGTSGIGTISVIAQKSGCSAASPVNMNVLKYNIINSVQSGLWNAASTWSTGTVPSENDNIRILNSHTITLGGNRTIDNIVIDAGGTLDAGTGNRTMIVTGDITVNGSLLGGNKPLELNGINTTIDGSGSISVTGDNIEINNGNKTILASANLTVSAGNIDIIDPNVTLTNYGSLTIAGDIIGNADGSSKWSNKATSTLRLGGALFSSGGTLLTSSLGNTVEYNGGAQNIYTPSSNTYHHLIISGTNSKTLQGNIKINGNLNLNGGALDAGANRNINIAGNWIANGGAFNSASGLVIFDGSKGQNIQSGGSFFNSVIIVGSGTDMLLDNFGLNGDLILNPGTRFNTNAYDTYLSGDLIRTGTAEFTASSGSLVFNGSGGQILMGGFSGTNSLTNLTIDATTDLTNNGGNSEITGTLVVNGSFDPVGDNNEFRFISNATGDARVGVSSGQISGEVVVERYVESGTERWMHLAAPVTGSSIMDLQDDIVITGNFTGSDNNTFGYSFAWYEPVATGKDDGWMFPNNNTDLITTPGDPTRGFVMWTYDLDSEPITLDLSGTLNMGSIDYNINYDDPEGWNLEANPYNADIDFFASSGWSGKSILQGGGTVFCIWDRNKGDYIERIDGVHSGTIAMGQSFWVEAMASGTMTSSESVKSSSKAALLRQIPKSVLEIALSNEDLTDYTYIILEDGSEDYFDTSDFSKLKNSYFNVSSYSIDGIELGVNRISNSLCNLSIPLNVEILKQGSYKITFPIYGFMDVEVTLYDSFTQQSILVSDDTQFDFDVNSDPLSYGAKRFSLIFERIINSDIETEFESSICEYDSGRISIENSQLNTQYFITWDGISISDTLMSANEVLNLNYDIRKLHMGENFLKLNAYQTDCEIHEIIKELRIFKNPLPEKPLTNELSTCLGESLEIELQASLQGNTFLWYDNIESENIAPIDTSLFYTTPDLTESVSYWVSELNSSGCKSDPAEISISVINIPEPKITSDGYKLISSSESGNQWYLDGELIPGATDQTIETVYPGEYTVRVSVGPCFEISEPYFQLVSAIGSDFTNEFHIYPNPVVNFMNIKFSRDLHFTDEISVEIYQLDGQKLLNSELDMEGGPLDLSWLNPGLYIMRLKSNEQTFTKKFLKK